MSWEGDADSLPNWGLVEEETKLQQNPLTSEKKVLILCFFLIAFFSEKKNKKSH